MKYLKVPESRMCRFDECAKIVGTKRIKDLRLDVCTRWNATYDLIDSDTRYCSMLNCLAEKDANFKHCPSRDEWNRVEKIIRNGERQESFINNMAEQMKGKFYKYWDCYSVVLACAIVLDPRYKLDYVDFTFKKIEPIEHIAEMKVESVQTTLYKLFSEYKCPKPMATTNVSSCVGSSSHTSGAVDDPDDHEDKEDNLDLYLEEARFSKKKHSKLEVLSWWKENYNRFPELSSMARDLMSILITTIASK
ncbi:zinc finger BED domain-containing protein RICESLEEPER 2-like [Castanea sativa]|uniref:zinc finger BED domain-containing protein RICESLEEPER 2-like n=1 Tax=Castanea sativa TaxID=21020 RepID=UPI003F64F913